MNQPTPIADMVERMLAASAPASAIVAAVRALEGVTQVTRDVDVTSRVMSREQARIRQQNWRNRKKEQQLAKEAQANDGADRNASITRDITVAPLSDCVVLTSLLSGEPLKESKKESSGMRARGTRMAPGAPLSDDHRAIIIAEGISDPEKLWAEFVDYWSDIPGQRGIKIKWDGTLRNRCRDVIKRGFNGHGPSNNRAHQASGPAPTRDTAIIAGMGRALERRRAARDATDTGREDVREQRRSSAPGGTDAELDPAPGDDGPSRQLAFLPAGHAGR